MGKSEAVGEALCTAEMEECRRTEDHQQLHKHYGEQQPVHDNVPQPLEMWEMTC